MLNHHSIKFLGIHITDRFSWTTNTTTVLKKSTAAPLLLEDAQENQHEFEAACVIL